jgi:phospholipid/cholesterol/gamma-HCH transport system permease protein
MLGGIGFAVLKESFEVLTLLFMSIYWTIFGPFDKGKIHFGGVAKQMFKLGSEAMGICFLMVALICLTMALQSSIMLNAVGGGSYLASGLGFLIFAEIGPLLTTIILAGRSGSAVAAEIANMSVCEEVKAIKSMAIPPVQYLVVPRFIAMSVATPILSFCASIFGCFSGFLIAYFFCDISFSNYMMGIRDGIAPITFLKSSIKALVFGWIVTLIACNKGLNAHGGAGAVGKATTSSVVAAICCIVLADTLFAFRFY